MTVVILAVVVLAAVAAVLARRQLAAGAPGRGPVAVVNDATGETVLYVLEDAVAEIEVLRARRDRLIDRLATAPRSTGRQKKRWDEAYREATACNAAMEELQGAVDDAS